MVLTVRARQVAVKDGGGRVGWAAAGLVASLLAPGLVLAQGVPVPFPGGPEGVRPPIYTQPGSSGQPGISTEPVPPSPTLRPAPSDPIPRPPEAVTAPAESERRSDGGEQVPKSKVPQVTSFPELTRGVGNSGTLLQD